MQGRRWNGHAKRTHVLLFRCTCTCQHISVTLCVILVWGPPLCYVQRSSFPAEAAFFPSSTCKLSHPVEVLTFQSAAVLTMMLLASLYLWMSIFLLLLPREWWAHPFTEVYLIMAKEDMQDCKVIRSLGRRCLILCPTPVSFSRVMKANSPQQQHTVVNWPHYTACTRDNIYCLSQAAVACLCPWCLAQHKPAFKHQQQSKLTRLVSWHKLFAMTYHACWRQSWGSSCLYSIE